MDRDDNSPRFGGARQLIFLLNVMSYRELAVHNLLSISKPFSSWDQLWAIGGRGLFGVYLHPKMGNAVDFLKHANQNGIHLCMTKMKRGILDNMTTI
jgi:hypothetical protein